MVALFTTAVMAAVVGCGGEDSATIPDSSHCPVQPLYHWAFVALHDGGAGTWVREDPSGKPLTATAIKAINDAVTNHCATATGSAESLDGGT